MPFDHTPEDGGRGGGGRARPKNVLGRPLADCSHDPMTGFYRTGCCETGPDDAGVHTVCAVMTEDFLKFSLASGNDLSTPRPEYGFAGLRPGDRWCVCAARWLEAYEANSAPKVVLEATHVRTLAIVPFEALESHALRDRA
ncbi:MAG: DUF2237 domain-containing protein [Pseudomonadota bacterium]